MQPRRAALFLIGLSILGFAGGCARVQRMTSQECMARAMYFESNRSSPEGMLAVGTVVMNRMESGKYPRNVCEVVGQKNQFAPGVLSKKMDKGKDLAMKTAKDVLRGKRYAKAEKAMFFHTAGYSYPYNNMHYVTVAGGNAFYEKRKNPTQTQQMVAARDTRLPFTPPQRAKAIAAIKSAPASAVPPVPASMSIEELIAENGG